MKKDVKAHKKGLSILISLLAFSLVSCDVFGTREEIVNRPDAAPPP